MSRVTERPRGREAVVAALVESARRLVAERGPADVSLREIADDAKVNFGLVYQYIGTKDQLLEIVYRTTSEATAAAIGSAATLADAVDLLLQRGDGTAARLIAWSVLESGGSDDLSPWSSTALDALVDLAQKDALSEDRTISREDGQVFAALTVATAIGWRLFGSMSLAAVQLDPADRERHTILVRKMIRRLADDLTAG